MGCEHVQIPGVGGVIICGRGQRKKCSVCGRDAVALCDYPITRKGKPATCDSPMCARHRHPVQGKSDEDWCQSHFDYEQRQAESASPGPDTAGNLPLQFGAGAIPAPPEEA